jgi:pyruvate,water dikinase
MAHAATVSFIRWFDEIGIGDIPTVGGKNASLGELRRALTREGVRVPNGFAVSAEAYREFLRRNDLLDVIRQALDGLDTANVDDLQARGRRIRQAILAAPMPPEIEAAILAAYDALGDGGGEPVDVAVRSSATAEDLPDASFAGQQETFLNVRGHAALIDACRRSFASLFTDRAMSYRVDKGFDHQRVALSIGVQRMVRSDLASSGVMFTIDTETGFADMVLINAAYGLGENVVQGAVNPDEFYIFKPTLLKGARPIVRKRLGTKEFKLVYDTSGTKMVKNVPVPPDDRARFALSDDEVLTLATWACRIEKHYSQTRHNPTPMDIEWAKDGRTGELFILQARPETVQSRRNVQQLEVYRLDERGPVLLKGKSVGQKIAWGAVRIVHGPDQLHEFQQGEVLVADKTDPDWEPVMKKAAAIITNRGGRTCHAAIVSRELGLPAVIGTEHATDVLRNGQAVTVSCAEGEDGAVYEGRLSFRVQRTDIKDLPRTRTKVMMNIGNPEGVLALSQIPNDGVGLVRLEFIISNWIGIHPLALTKFDWLPELRLKADIERRTAGFTDKTQFFVEKLAEGVGLIAAAFYPRDVIVRLSDFKTNEYANLLGGSYFESTEENPMLGFRGASRYYHPRYRDGFALECHALKRVRDDMGFTNLKIMVPFCRTVEEGKRVQEEMARHGLKRGEGGLEVYVMCEIPSNVILADAFAEIFDGFSIGSNDLTQLILGVDRDSEIVAHIFDERNPAVLSMIGSAIRTARQKNRKIGICGQAPSDFPEFTKFLVDRGIDSISLNPDAVVRAIATIAAAEGGIAPVRAAVTSA